MRKASKQRLWSCADLWQNPGRLRDAVVRSGDYMWDGGLGAQGPITGWHVKHTLFRGLNALSHLC